MKLYRQIIISFLTAIVTVFVAYGGYTLYAEGESDEYQKFYAFENTALVGWNVVDLFVISTQYHNSMNDYFNYKMDLFMELVDNDPKFYEHKDFKTPAELTDPNFEKEDFVDIKYPTTIEKCKTNVGSYCVSMGALDLYWHYLEVLNQMKTALPVINPGTSIQEVLDNFETRDNDVQKEAKDSQFVMETTIAAYDEFKSAYPMHKKYKDIIKTLDKYRRELKDVKNEALTFPLRFVDATSDKCE